MRFCCVQGLFERHKLIVATQLCMAVLRSRGELQRTKFEFLLRGPKEMGVDNPLRDWVSDALPAGLPAALMLPQLAPDCVDALRTATYDAVCWCLQVPKSVWGSVQALKELEDYTALPDDLVGSSKRWREWMELERPGERLGYHTPACHAAFLAATCVQAAT